MITTSSAWKEAVANGTRFKNKLNFTSGQLGAEARIVQHLGDGGTVSMDVYQESDGTYSAKATIDLGNFPSGIRRYFVSVDATNADEIRFCSSEMTTLLGTSSVSEQIFTNSIGGLCSIWIIKNNVDPSGTYTTTYSGNFIDFSATFDTIPTVAQFRAEVSATTYPIVPNGYTWTTAYRTERTEILDDKIFSLTFSDAIEDGSIPLGTAIMNQVEVELQNFDNWFSVPKFKGSTFTLYFGLEINGTTEWIQKGVYTVQTAKIHNNLVSLVAYDRFCLAEKTRTVGSYFSSGPTHDKPRTILYNLILEELNKPYGSIPYSDKTDLEFYVYKTISSTETEFYFISSEYSLRQAFAWLAMTLGGYIYVNNEGKFAVKRLCDINFDSTNARELVNISNFEIDEETTLTGLEFTFPQDTAESDLAGTSALHGTSGCIVSVSDCPIFNEIYTHTIVDSITTTKTATRVAEILWNRITNYGDASAFKFRPFSVTAQADPSIECGDSLIFYDALGNEYDVVCTALEYTADGRETYSCNIEIPKTQNFEINDTAQLTDYSVQSTIQYLKDNYNMVVEEGTETVGSFTWRYRKWSNGQCEIQGTYDISGVALTYASGSIFYNAVSLPSLPSWFAAANIQSTLRTTNGLVWHKHTGTSTIQLISATSQSSWSGSIYMYYRGTWS